MIQEYEDDYFLEEDKMWVFRLIYQRIIDAIAQRPILSTSQLTY